MLASMLAATLLSATPSAPCAPLPSAWIALEVIASEPAGDEPAQLIEIDAAGCATLRYASFDTRAGLYRRQLDGTELESLRGEVERGALLRFDTAAVEREVAQRERERAALARPGEPERFAVACGDTYRLVIEEAAGRASIEWYAPKQVASRHPEVQALRALSGVLDQLQRLAADERRLRIAAVAP